MSTPTSATGSSSGSGGRYGKDQKDPGAGPLIKSPQSPADTLQHYNTVASPASSGCVTSGRLFTISVVGLSGSERDKGSVGVGKSCLCNRFVRPLEDEYRTDHISTLSQVDFGGRVVNNDHWLYWGERNLIADDGAELSFRVVEQTEFVDDESFQTLKGSSGQRDAYSKRCSTVRLQSADKLMYMCKDQLGLESEYEQKSLPDGKCAVDGFLCVYDVSSVPNRPVERQAEFVAQLLQNIVKTKKPVVFVTTKNDEFDERCAKEAEKLISKREFRSAIPTVVECSSHQNVNVETGFVLLAHMIEKTRSKPKILCFNEALKIRREIVDVATAAYVQKLRSAVQDHRMTWSQLCRLLADDADFQHFCELCGNARAQKYHRQHQRELRDRYVQRKMQKQISKLPEIFPHLVADLNLLRGKTWDEVLQILPTLPQFSRLFQPVGTLASNVDSPNDLSTMQTNMDDFRLSAEILYTPEAEECFRNYVNSLETDFRRRKLQDEFLQLLSGCSQVTPGKPLSDLRIFFIGKECFESLSESDLQSIYDHYQRQIIRKARRDFVELLQEQIEEFVSRVLFRAKNHVANGSPTTGSGDKARYMTGLSEGDMQELHAKLQEDVRYRQLNRLHQARDNMICQYIGFLGYPLRQHCPAEPRCVDTLVENLFENRLYRSPLYNDNSENCRYSLDLHNSDSNNAVNLLCFGLDGLSNQLVRETQNFLTNDEFVLNDLSYIFNLRCIDGDLHNLPHNLLCSPHYRPNGLVCVYSSRSSLEFLKDGISRRLFSLLKPRFDERDEDTTSDDLLIERGRDENTAKLAAGLPLVILLACDPSHIDDLPYLQQQGARLAEAYRCHYVGLEPSTSHVTADRRAARSAHGFFTQDQLQRVLTVFARHSAPKADNNIVKHPITNGTDAAAVDIKLLICFMCGDDFPPELVLSPFLNYQLRNNNNAGVDADNRCRPTMTSSSSSSTPPPPSLNLCGQNSTTMAARSFQNEANADGGRRRSFVVETFLPNLGRKFRAEITVTAYHTGFVWLAEHVYHHGYILVYSAKRRASLANLYSFAHLIPDVIPLLVIAVGEVAEFFSDPATNILITEGNDIADRIGARFITLSKAAEQQISIFTPFLDEVCSKKDEVESTGLVKTHGPSSHPAPSGRATEISWNNTTGGLGSSPYYDSSRQKILTDNNGAVVGEPASHYAHLSQFASGWPLNQKMASPDIPKKLTSIPYQSQQQQHDYVNSAYHLRTPPNAHNNRTLSSSQSRPTSGDVYRDAANDPMSRSYVSPPSNDASSFYANLVDNVVPANHNYVNQSASVYVAGKTQTPMSGSNLSVGGISYEKSPSPSSISTAANSVVMATVGETARNRRLVPNVDDNRNNADNVDDGSAQNRLQHQHHVVNLNRGDSSVSARSTRGSLVHLHRQATSEIEIYYNEQRSPNCPRPLHHGLAHSLRRTLFGWWESGSEGALVKSGYSSSQANTPLGGGSPMSVREINGKALSRKFYSKDDSIGGGNAKFADRGIHYERDNKNSSQSNASTPRSIAVGGLNASVAAPLATPESIEVGIDYMTVKDALGNDSRDFVEDEEQYATVASILPRDQQQSKGRQQPIKKAEIQVPLDSSSGESLEKSSVYEKTGRKPTPHRREKKKMSTPVGPSIAERVRLLNASTTNVPPSPPPPVPPYTRERLFKSGANNSNQPGAFPLLRSSASEESLLDSRALEPKRNFSMRQKVISPASSPGLIRRMASSFRFRRGDKIDHEESKSVPQSPVFSDRVFVLPPFQAGIAIEQPSDGGGGSGISSFWLNPSSKLSSGSSISPKRNANEKPQRKISRDIVKKYSGELPAKISNKKRSSKEANQSQLVPPEATLKDLSPSSSDMIPIFVRKCVDFIEAEGLTMEGIYRVPGNQAHVMLLEQRFAEDPNISFSSMDIPVNAVATSLKNFFSYLSEPVFPYSLYDDLISAMDAKDQEEKRLKIKDVLERLLPENRAILRYFIAHLRKVAHHAHMTAMDHRNLAKCWWPTLLRPQFDSFETMAQMTQRLEEFVQILLDNPDLI